MYAITEAGHELDTTPFLIKKLHDATDLESCTGWTRSKQEQLYGTQRTN
jgi:hypothetical protein